MSEYMQTQSNICAACCADAPETSEVCEDCAERLASRDFKEWMAQLRREMVSDGLTATAAERYGTPLDWLPSFMKDRMPREALDDEYASHEE